VADSILDSTKKVCGLSSDYTAFDPDIIMHINSTFSVLDQLGIGPAGGYMIVDNTETWADFSVPSNQKNLVRTYMFLRVRSLFDPPTTSYLIDAMNKQIDECVWRLSAFREGVEHPLDELLLERRFEDELLEEEVEI